MPFFMVDDGVWGHPKFALLSNDAVALWVTAGSWCARYLTDGLVPFQSLALVRGSKNAAQELVDAGLWLETPDGWLFHQWDHYNWTKAYVEDRRAYEREKKRRQRAAKNDDVPQIVPTGHSGDSRGTSRRDSPGSPGMDGMDSVSSSSSSSSKNNEAFDSFWKVYPRREGKQAARKAWAKAVALADALDIIAGAERFRDDPNREPEFTPHPSTWLNAGRWEDDPLPPRSGPTQRHLTAAQVRDAEFRDRMRRFAEEDAQEARRGTNALGGYSDTQGAISALSVAPDGNEDDSWMEA